MIRVYHYQELHGKLNPSGIEVATNNQRKALSMAGVSVVKNGPYDVLHLCTIGPRAFALAKFAKHNGIPVVISTHVTAEEIPNSYLLGDKAYKPIKIYLKKFYGMADVLISPTQYTADLLLKEYGLTNRIEAVSNGLDASEFKNMREKRKLYRERFDLNGVVVYTIGHVFQRKGLKTFNEIARAVDTQFVWYGKIYNGLHASGTSELIKTAPPNVRFTDWIDDKVAAHASGDIFLFPTWAENQGIALLEAAACGKSAVVRNLPVFAEWKSCIKATTVPQFIEALKVLLKNRTRREVLGKHLREESRAHSLKNVGKKLSRIYFELM